MSLLFMDGFGAGDYNFKWDLTSSSFSGGATTTPRTPSNYYAISGYSRSHYKSFTAANKVILGVGLYTENNAGFTFYGDAGATSHVSVTRNASTGFLEIRRGTTSGTLLATGTTAIFDLKWNYIEISATISDTIGEVHVRLNGLSVDEVSYTGDTKNAGTNTTIDKIMLYTGGTISLTTNYADVYILNGLGATNNAFLGDVIVRTLSPSGNGSSSQLTGSDADQVNNYLQVDEHPMTSADYNESSNIGDRDTYTLTDVPTGVTTIYGAQLTSLMGKSDVTAASAKPALKSGATIVYGATRGLATSSVAYYDLYEASPFTAGTWTVSEINGTEAGMEVV